MLTEFLKTFWASVVPETSTPKVNFTNVAPIKYFSCQILSLARMLISFIFYGIVTNSPCIKITTYLFQNLEKYKSQIQRIVLASGRQESGVTKIFDALKSKPVDAEEIALLHNIFANDVVGHMGRGYTVLGKL